MSRSKKRTPVGAVNGTLDSEKQDKRDYNRRYRRVCKQFLHVNPECELPPLRQYSNLWAMTKDGKRWFDPEQYPKWMRK
jgi:hypothetical protein